MGILRDRMAKDLAIGNYSPRTAEVYLRCVRRFAAYHMRSPAEMGKEEVRDYLAHLVNDRHLSAHSVGVNRSAIAFLYRVTLDRPLEVASLPVPRRRKHLPQILLGSELTSLWGAVRNPIYRAIFLLMYASGLRISEACALRPEQIDSQRMVIRVRGKGDKDRYTLLSKRLLRHLRGYWRDVRPNSGWMFPGRKPHCHITRRATRHAFRCALAAARITKPVTTHSLRHTFATHLVDLGTPLTVVQAALGHASLRTTRIYLHTSVEAISRTTSPLDLLGTPNGAIFG